MNAQAIAHSNCFIIKTYLGFSHFNTYTRYYESLAPNGDDENEDEAVAPTRDATNDVCKFCQNDRRAYFLFY